MTTITIKYNGKIYDIYENGEWTVSRTSPLNVLTYLAEISKNKSIKIEFEDKLTKKYTQTN